jgi:hypothetical protein
MAWWHEYGPWGGGGGVKASSEDQNYMETTQERFKWSASASMVLARQVVLHIIGLLLLLFSLFFYPNYHDQNFWSR